MRNFNKYLGAIAIMAMLFTSCSKEETNVINDDEMATLSFGTVLNDLTKQATATKQQVPDGYPECSDDSTPSYVHVVLEGDENVGTIGDPLMIPVNDTPYDEDGDGVEEYFTEESSELELTPGNYDLTYFAVYNDDDELIWLAPTRDGDFSDWVDSALPLDINLGAGVKKYVDVEVLCFDDRVVNEYGYLFFDIIGTEAYEFCVFANYCNDAGRHYPANYTIDVYLGTDDTGELLYTLSPEVATAGEDPSAEPVCFALPNIASFDDDEDYIYWEATLSDWEDVYGTVGDMTLNGTLSRNDIMANLNDDGETVEYAHIRFNCGDDDDPGNGNGDDDDADDDGVPDDEDNCPDVYNPLQTDEDNDGVGNDCDDCADTQQGVEVDADGCPIDGGNGHEGCLPEPDAGCETAVLEQIIDLADFPIAIEVPFYPLELNGVQIGTIYVDLDPDGDQIIVNVDLNEGWTIDDFEITLPELDEDGAVCVNDINENDFEFIFDETGVEDINDYPFEVIIRSNVCD